MSSTASNSQYCSKYRYVKRTLNKFRLQNIKRTTIGNTINSINKPSLSESVDNFISTSSVIGASLQALQQLQSAGSLKLPSTQYNFLEQIAGNECYW